MKISNGKRKSNLDVLITEEKLQSRIREIAAKINKDYEGKEPTIVGVLKGSFIFMADLIRQIPLPLSCDFIRVSSYDNRKEPNGTVRIEFDITQSIKGKDVILVEDIVDTGSTVKFLIDTILAKKPKSLKICALLKKAARGVADVDVDYLGFTIPNVFVAGYGLDYAGKYRNLPYLAAFKNKG